MTLQPDPVEAEATGQPYVVATYAGHDFKLSLDAETWPLGLIAVSVGVNKDGNIVSNPIMVGQALTRLLGDQWGDFLRAFPRRRDLVPASRAFAAAAGLAGDERDKAFGALPRLLATLQIHPTAVEATLGEMGLDYRDRWRFDADGQRRLTLRQIHVRLTHAPRTSALAIAQNDGKALLTAGDIVLMDLFEAIAKVPHPSRPLTDAQRAERKKEEKKQTNVTSAVEDYKRRRSEKTQKQSAIESAKANARAQMAKSNAHR